MSHMISYALILSASMIHALDVGLARYRGAVTLLAAIAGAAVASVYAIVWHRYGQAVGAATAFATIFTVRRLGRWLNEEGGWHTVCLLTGELVRAAGEFVWGLVVAFLRGLFSPAARPVPLPAVSELPETVPWDGETQVAAFPHGDRWGQLTPGETTEMPELRLVPRPVETYRDWLPTCVETSGGYNAAARTALSRFGVPRATWARHLADLRANEEAA